MEEDSFPLEKIHHLNPKEEIVIQKPARYMSKFRSAVVLENKSKLHERRTMGVANVKLPSPEKYLKKHEKEPKPPRNKHNHPSTCSMRKAPVPARTDLPPRECRSTKESRSMKESRSTKDFSHTAVLVPTKPKPMCVDTVKGHKEILENSGLVPKYVKKKDFGEVPTYLQQRKEKEKKAQEEQKRLEKEKQEQNASNQPSEEERQAVLEALKKQWDARYQEYQGLSFIIDNLSKKAHKLRLEEEMDQIEKDIASLGGSSPFQYSS